MGLKNDLRQSAVPSIAAQDWLWNEGGWTQFRNLHGLNGLTFMAAAQITNVLVCLSPWLIRFFLYLLILLGAVDLIWMNYGLLLWIGAFLLLVWIVLPVFSYLWSGQDFGCSLIGIKLTDRKGRNLKAWRMLAYNLINTMIPLTAAMAYESYAAVVIWTLINCIWIFISKHRQNLAAALLGIHPVYAPVYEFVPVKRPKIIETPFKKKAAEIGGLDFAAKPYYVETGSIDWIKTAEAAMDFICFVSDLPDCSCRQMATQPVKALKMYADLHGKRRIFYVYYQNANKQIEELIQEQQKKVSRYNRKVLTALKDQGLHFDYEDMLNVPELMTKEALRNVTAKHMVTDQFWDFEYGFWIDACALIEKAKKAGAVVIWKTEIIEDADLYDLLSAGIDGMDVFSPDQGMNFYRYLCKQHDLLMIMASDGEYPYGACAQRLTSNQELEVKKKFLERVKSRSEGENGDHFVYEI